MSTSTKKYTPQTFFTNDRSIDSAKSIILNYNGATITHIDKSGYNCNGTYESNSQGPQLIYKDGKTTYNCNADKVYIMNDLHTINGVVMDGEMVIHHTVSSSAGTNYKDIYVVFPLHGSSNPPNEIDGLMSVASVENKVGTFVSLGLNTVNPHLVNKPLNLNPLLKDGLFIVYESVFEGRNSRSPPDSIVLLSVTPIDVDTIPTVTDLPYPIIVYQNKNYKLVRGKLNKNEGFVSEINKGFSTEKLYGSIKEGFREGLETKDVSNMLSNMECELIPYDMSGNQDVVKTYLVESTFFNESTTNNSIVMMKYFLFFVFFMVIVYVIIPYFYIFFAVRCVLKSSDIMEKLRLVGGMEVFFQFTMSMIIIIFLSLAQLFPESKNIRAYNMIGFFTLILLLVSYLLIEIQKVTSNLLQPIIGDNQFKPGDMPPISQKVGAAFEVIPNFIRNLANDVEHTKQLAQ